MKTVSFVRVIGVDPTLSIIFSPSSPFLPSFFLPLWKTCSSNFVFRVCSPGERGGEGKKRDRKERTNKPANIVQKFPHPFPRKMAVAHFKFSPRNFGFVFSLRVWIVLSSPFLFSCSPTSRFPQFSRITRQTCCLFARRKRTKQRDAVSRRDRGSYYDISLERVEKVSSVF